MREAFFPNSAGSLSLMTEMRFLASSLLLLPILNTSVVTPNSSHSARMCSLNTCGRIPFDQTGYYAIEHVITANKKKVFQFSPVTLVCTR